MTDPDRADLERGVHDVGGLSLDGDIDRSEHAQSLFEKRVDALVMLLSHPQLGAFKVDALRRAVEQLPPEQYRTLAYYPRWIRAIRRLLVEQSVVSDAEVEAKLTELRARNAAEPADA